MKTLVAMALLLLMHFNLSASDLVYPASDIPDSMKINAYAVIRESKTEFEYNSPSTGIEFNYLALTVLNKNGDKSANFGRYYDKFTSIDDLKITIYDASGKRIKKVKSSDIVDNSIYTGSETLITDGRFKAYSPVINTYPYTVVIEYRINYKGILGIPKWVPQNDNNISVQNSSYKLKVATGLNVNFKEKNCSHANSIENTYSVYSWEAKSIKAYEYETYMPRVLKNTISATIVPVKFEMDGKQGLLDSWENYGKWVYELNNQENKISDKTLAEIRQLTQNASSDYEKVRYLYKYLQNKTRYVSVQLGIGGLKPFDASITDKYGYGDCKALSNYMKILLKEVGINSIYTFVYSGLIPEYDIPQDLFNHAMLTVPLEQDTLFLECTNQYNPFGFVGKSTSKRPVLLITPEGGKLVYNKNYTAEQNLQARKAYIQFDTKGIAQIKVSTFYQGLQYENIFPVLYIGAEDQKKWAYNYVRIPSVNIKKFQLVPDDQPLPIGKFEFEAESSEYLTISSKRVFLPLNLMNRNENFPATTKPRKFDFELTYAYSDIDTIDYVLPAGLKIESVPADVELKTKYGEFTSKTIVKKDTIQYIRHIKSTTGVFPANEFIEFADYMKKVAKADAGKIALLKN